MSEASSGTAKEQIVDIVRRQHHREINVMNGDT
jgi:hypothetical protein